MASLENQTPYRSRMHSHFPFFPKDCAWPALSSIYRLRIFLKTAGSNPCTRADHIARAAMLLLGNAERLLGTNGSI